MFSSKAKVLLIVSVLLLFTGLATVGCGSHAKNSWVNTDSMPGRTFKPKDTNSKIVYLGSSKSSSDVNFAPNGVSFEFKDLK